MRRSLRRLEPAAPAARCALLAAERAPRLAGALWVRARALVDLGAATHAGRGRSSGRSPAALAEVAATRSRPVAVFWPTPTLGRQLAPMVAHRLGAGAVTRVQRRRWCDGGGARSRS